MAGQLFLGGQAQRVLGERPSIEARRDCDTWYQSGSLRFRTIESGAKEVTGYPYLPRIGQCNGRK